MLLSHKDPLDIVFSLVNRFGLRYDSAIGDIFSQPHSWLSINQWTATQKPILAHAWVLKVLLHTSHNSGRYNVISYSATHWPVNGADTVLSVVINYIISFPHCIHLFNIYLLSKNLNTCVTSRGHGRRSMVRTLPAFHFCATSMKSSPSNLDLFTPHDFRYGFGLIPNCFRKHVPMYQCVSKY